MIAKKAGIKGGYLGLNCNEDTCTAYEQESDMIAISDAVDVANRLLRDLKYGYSYDDLQVEAVGFMRERAQR